MPAIWHPLIRLNLAWALRTKQVWTLFWTRVKQWTVWFRVVARVAEPLFSTVPPQLPFRTIWLFKLWSTAKISSLEPWVKTLCVSTKISLRHACQSLCHSSSQIRLPKLTYIKVTSAWVRSQKIILPTILLSSIKRTKFQPRFWLSGITRRASNRKSFLADCRVPHTWGRGTWCYHRRKMHQSLMHGLWNFKTYKLFPGLMLMTNRQYALVEASSLS